MRAFEFLKEGIIDEAPLPGDWDTTQFGPGSTFKQRLTYALDRAKELGRGSSRVAMTIKYKGRNTALKVALNTKGLAQNEVEKDVLMSEYAKKSSLLIPIIDYDKQNKQPVWIQTQIAKPATSRQLCQLIGCLSLTHLVGMAGAPSSTVKTYIATMKRMGKTKEEIESTYRYAMALKELNKKFDLELEDFDNYKNWGLVNGNPVLIDLGFNSEVAMDYYESNEFVNEEIIDEAPLPSDWDAKAFGPKSSFKSRLAYALERAKELGRGSSRVAMTIEYQGKPTALKVALNKKGLAQNEVEKDILMSNYVRSSNMVIPIIDYDKQNKQPVWIQTQIAKPATSKQLCNLIGCLSLTHLVDMAVDMANDTPDAVKSFIKTMKEQGKSKEEIESTYQYALLLSELNKQFDLLLSDFKFQDNWGLVKGKPVLIDLGFNTEVLSTYYESNEFVNEEIIDEAPLPSDWDASKFGPGSSFRQRVSYALERAKQLGRGSSRVAMIIEYEGRPTVLKVALNKKGLAQNEVEKDILSSKQAKKTGIVIPIIDYDTANERPTWVHTELAKPVNDRQLCKIIGCLSLTHLCDMSWAVTGKKRWAANYQNYLGVMKKKGKTKEQIESTLKYALALAELQKNFNLEISDFEESENWGLFNGRPVLIDVGLNTEVLNTYYNY